MLVSNKLNRRSVYSFGAFDGHACSVSDPPMPVPIGPASTDAERIEPIVHRDYCFRTGEMESVMKVRKPLKQRALVGASRHPELGFPHFRRRDIKSRQIDLAR